MHFKLIIVTVDDADTDALVDTARREGATGATVITRARGEGLHGAKGSASPRRGLRGRAARAQRVTVTVTVARSAPFT